MKAVVNIAGSLALAVFLLIVPQPGSAQDLRGEIDAIIKDYLASHPEEVGEIVKNYMIEHPEAVGQIIAELLKHRPAASTAPAPAPAPAQRLLRVPRPRPKRQPPSPAMPRSFSPRHTRLRSAIPTAT